MFLQKLFETSLCMSFCLQGLCAAFYSFVVDGGHGRGDAVKVPFIPFMPPAFFGCHSSRCQLWFRFAAAAALLVVPILLSSVVTDENQDASWEKAGIYRIIQ